MILIKLGKRKVTYKKWLGNKKKEEEYWKSIVDTERIKQDQLKEINKNKEAEIKKKR